MRAEIYARYSDHKQDDGYSIEYQLSECEAFIERQGLTLHKAYIDQAVTGTKVAGRDNFFQLIHDIKDGLIDVVVVYKYNRIFRNAYESHKYRKLFKKHGVKLLSATQQIDDETSAGRLMINVLADIDQYQSETISDHVKSGMREMAKQGYFTGGTVPYGYKLETVFDNGKKQKKRYIPDEKESKIVNDIFKLYSENYSLRYLQTYMKEIGAETRQGKMFGITTISRMLRNDFYIGTLRYDAQGHEPIIIENIIPPIIDLDLWQAVQRRHESNKLVKPRKRKDLYSLTGKIHCKMCGSHFFGIRSGSVQRGKKYDYKYYTCANHKNYQSCDCKRIKKEYLEDIVLTEIKKHILNENSINEIANEIVNQLEKSPNEIKQELKELNNRKTDLEEHIETLLDLDNLKKTKTANKILQNKIMKIEAELSEIDNRIYSLENQVKQSISLELIKDYLYKMLSNAETTNDEILKNIFDNFVDKILVDDTEIAVFLIVRPFGRFEYKQTHGQPQWALNTKVKRE
jgi:site-specific DNA recombinase